MAHMADGTEIVTADQARRFVLDNDCEEFRDDLAASMGMDVVRVAETGDVVVWLGEPETLHLLGDKQLLDAVRTLPNR
jgi:hypothetical protein